MQSKLFRLFSRIFSSLMFVLTILFVFFIFPKQKALALTETRYMRSDTQTINGLSAYQLGITSSSSSLSTMVSSQTGNGQQNQTVYWGVRVWQRNNAGTETELTSGTPVAQVSRTSGSGIQSATWTPPSTTLATTDSIDLFAAAAGADIACRWDLTGVSLTQRVPAAQTPGSYSLAMTLTVL